jgi:hypothetical protein
MAIWTAAGLILLLPLIARAFTDEMNWDAADFILLGAMLATACGACELAGRTRDGGAYRAAVGVAVAAAFILVWMNLAVGVIGTEEDPANLMFAGVLAVAIVGAALARIRPRGMARASVATALAQMLVAVIALSAGMQHGGHSPAAEILGVNASFAALWLTSAWLFLRAAREKPPEDAAP